jgi:membrane protease YdiL (CAAX protease family)
MTIETAFFDEKQRLRSGWRFAIFAFAFFILAVLIATVSTGLFMAAGGVPGSPAFLIVFNLALLAAVLVVGWLCNRYLEQLPFTALGASFTAGWLSRFSIGLIAGVVTLSFAVTVCILFGGLSFSINDAGSDAIFRTLGISLLVFMIAAASEEALSRGYPMQTFFHSNLRAFGIFFTAALFASGHLGNPDVGAFAWFNTFLAGVWFGVAYWRTGDLWFPFGMHLAWNWMQGAFFGIEVSGLTDITSAPLLKELDRGPAWLTGEKYGIEAGIAATMALLISTLVIFLLPAKTARPTAETHRVPNI